MDWVLVIFVTFKALVLGTGMFFAIKWHYDRGNEGKQTDKRAVLRASFKVAAVFTLGLLCLGLLTYFLVTRFGLDMNL
ncbi:hypothetical protein D3C72_199580 [compost metagenome]